MSKKREAIDGAAGACPKCNGAMQRYQHPAGWAPRAGRKWFRYWDRCIPCRHVQHYESARAVPE